MASHTLSLDFIARKDKQDPGRVCIFGRITIDGPPKEFSLKEFIPYDKWDAASESVKGKTQEVKDINKHIENTRTKIANIFRALQDTQDYVSAQNVKEAYTGKSHKDHTVRNLFKKHEKKFQKILAPGTWKNYAATHQYVLNFIKHQFKSEDLHVRQLNYEFISDLESYIPEHPLKNSDPCLGNGIAKHLERFRGIVNWGDDLGWFKKEPFRKFKICKAKTKREKLKAHQLKMMETKRLTSPDLEFARDLFLFACYTGFSFAEVSSLSMSDFEISDKGKFWCTKYRQKSDELEAVPLIHQAVLLVKKYKDLPKSVANETVFPPITNQYINRLLKILTEVFDIGFPLTFHLSRHTFGYYAVKAGLDIKVIKVIMGHRKIATTDIYTCVDEEIIEFGMEKFEAAGDRRRELPSPTEYINNAQPIRLIKSE
ncbi:site-specific integrase [Chitinophaga sp. NPDC101104]|uniref:site-specific integrase n=1 Tax=Chitinophaga sp. NPDC101104 TaxID=3390561 RepID=UPI003CFD3056